MSGHTIVWSAVCTPHSQWDKNGQKSPHGCDKIFIWWFTSFFFCTGCQQTIYDKLYEHSSSPYHHSITAFPQVLSSLNCDWCLTLGGNNKCHYIDLFTCTVRRFLIFSTLSERECVNFDNVLFWIMCLANMYLSKVYVCTKWWQSL